MYRASGSDPSDSQIRAHLAVQNTGDAPVDLGRVSLRYWFTRDGGSAAELESHCDWAQLGCGGIARTIGDAPAVPGADTYLELSFDGGTLEPGGSTGPIQIRLNRSNWQAFDESDDHSYDGSAASFTENPNVTVYVDGEPVWGAEPAA
nr:cellulose binding domain-containing protein [Streptomonospora litoralis]